MTVTLEQVEAVPADNPAVTPYPHRPVFPGEDAELDPALIWQRLEAYIAHRWTPREVAWKVEGPGEWTPPLTPVVGAITARVWRAGTGWEDVTLEAGPFGYLLPGAGPYEITATVGEGEPPEAVLEAWRRMHEYTRGIAEQFKGDTAFVQSGDTEAIRGWTGKAMQLSGAADLLRPYRRA